MFLALLPATPVASQPLFPNQHFEVGRGPRSIAVHDLNRDGIPDLASADFERSSSEMGISVVFGMRDGSFSPPVHYPAGVGIFAGVTRLQIADLNTDANPDLIFMELESPSGDISVLLGDGIGHFESALHFGSGAYSYPIGFAVGDWDRNGRQDLAISGANPLALFLNTGPVPPLHVEMAWPSGGPVHPFNPNANRSIAVAFLGSTEVDVESFDLSTIRLNGAGIRRLGNGEHDCRVGDVNGDGWTGAVCRFDRAEMNLPTGEPVLVMQGRTVDGDRLEGELSPRFVPGLP